jgi:hypothetical protein
MVRGKRREEKSLLTKESILERISEYDIFRSILGNFKIGVSFCNPLRGENKPSAIIRQINGKLILKDYVAEEYNGDCFHLVQHENNCSFYEALQVIEKNFNLGNPEPSKIITWKQPVIKEFKPPLIQVETRNPTKEELHYWNLHHLDLIDLKDIYFPKSIYRNRKKVYLSDNILTFCYWFEEEKAWKIYRPYGKTGGDVPIHLRKWDSSLRFDYIEDLEAIKGVDNAFVATSRKDKMVLKKALGVTGLCNIQGENIAAINDKDMQFIKNNSRKQYTCGDRDQAGKTFSWLLTNEFGFLHVNPPDDKPKDFADWAREEGLIPILNHFRIKKIV